MGDKGEDKNVGHYVMGRTIGRGAFAKVKEAYHDLTKVRVAAKIMNKRKMRNAHMISKIKRQIKILQFMNHPNIIKLYDVLDTSNELFVIMEIAAQGELYEYIQTHDISEEKAKFFFKQIISGVDYIHQNLIIHRDLKPENILMDSNNLLKIVDFGLSNLMKDGRFLKTPCGSRNYAAPQVIREQNYQGTSVDIWSCGIILYTMLVGAFPFQAESVSLLSMKIIKGNFSLPPSLNPIVIDLIRRLLQTDPIKRIKMHQIKNHPWLCSKMPIYSQICNIFCVEKPVQFQLDQEIFNKIKTLIPLDLTNQKMIKAIKKKESHSFVVTYQLLKDEKYRQSQAQENVKRFSSEFVQQNSILEPISNELKHEQKNQSKDFFFGRTYFIALRQLIDMIIEVFRLMKIDFTIKNALYCLKCSYISQQQRKLNNWKLMECENKEEDDQKNVRCSKTQIVFILQIYCVNLILSEYLIDLHLSQGHPILFLELIHKLFNMLDSAVKR